MTQETSQESTSVAEKRTPSEGAAPVPAESAGSVVRSSEAAILGLAREIAEAASDACQTVAITGAALGREIEPAGTAVLHTSATVASDLVAAGEHLGGGAAQALKGLEQPPLEPAAEPIVTVVVAQGP